MDFNLVLSLLAASSVHDTVHIFKLGQQAASKNNSETSNLNQKEYRRFVRDDASCYGDFL
ncbi:hypothetical protein BYT27DRAFT_7199861 [Phlegmacium glaucopus]|nr:hypothetical protein BYT27DRAFT_7199861 [Phlegmacium glaucopus]